MSDDRDRPRIRVEIPSAERYGALCLRVSDFAHHKNEIVYRVLPDYDRIIVTAYGYPDFEVHRVPVGLQERVARSGETERDGVLYVPTSYFLDRTTEYVVERLPEVGGRLVVVRYGWPEYLVRSPSWEATTRIAYPAFEPPAPGDEERP